MAEMTDEPRAKISEAPPRPFERSPGLIRAEATMLLRQALALLAQADAIELQEVSYAAPKLRKQPEHPPTERDLYYIASEGS
jgi:hypothetical protein